MSLDLLGADGLDSQYITLRVKRIDAEKLKKELGGRAGALAPAALHLVDWAPRPALEAALPPAVKWAKDKYGVDLEYVVTDVPPQKGGPTGSGFRGGVAAGLGLAAAAAALVKVAGALLRKGHGGN